MGGGVEQSDPSALLRSLISSLPHLATATAGQNQTQRQTSSLTNDESASSSRLGRDAVAEGRKPLPNSLSVSNNAARQLNTEPARIMVWPLALKYTSLLLAYYPDRAARVKNMIKNQHDNEQAWWAGRQALIRQQASREYNNHQPRSVLRSIGTNVSNSDSAVSLEEELKSYDRKVHIAMKQMTHSMAAELKTMDIPFFCIDKSLIFVEKHGANYDSSGPFGELQILGETTDDETFRKGKISITELRTLQGEMLRFLEDYCKT